MRRALTFICEGATLVATLDEAPGACGLLIVSGGNEVRSGAHRGMAELAGVMASKGCPVFRFDRRGIGDSEGANGGFRSSGPDIAAALAAFRVACPQLSCVVAFGNCDAASALVLHDVPVDARVLANPWVIETTDALPPPAAIRHRYAKRLRDPRAWVALLMGRIDILAAIRGLAKIANRRKQPEGLAAQVIDKLASQPTPTTILLATGDATAIAFDDVWKQSPVTRVTVDRLASTSHSFASDSDFAALVEVLAGVLG